MTEANKVSGSAIMERLDALVQNTGPLGLLLNPGDLIIYKPNPRSIEKGAAAKFNYRLRPIVTDTGYVAHGGEFWMELVQQVPSDNEFAKFGWRSPTGESLGLSAKLGLPDLSAFLLAYREIRMRGKPVPESVRPIVKTPEGKWGPSEDGTAVGLIHQFKDRATGTKGKTSTIKWQFHPTRGSILEISKGADGRRSISFSLAEEIQFVAYMEAGLRALLIANA